jgi:hypothetical protein
MMRFRLARWLLGIGFCFMLSLGLPDAVALQAAAGGIALILSERGPAYEELAEAFAEALGDRRGLRVLHLDGLDARGVQALAREVRLLVPVGMKATRAVAEHAGGQSAVLALMVPRSGFEAESWPAALPRRRLSAVYIDQPPGRSLSLIEKVLPKARQVGVIHSQQGLASLAALSQEAARRRLSLRLAEVPPSGEVAAALRQVLAESDVLLLQPDALAINAHNVQHVLLTAYRYRVPVIGFSQGLVKAGAIAAVYSTPAQIGAQGGQIARQWRAGEGDLPPPGYCDEYAIALNPHVARSLGIGLPSESVLKSQLGAEP